MNDGKRIAEAFGSIYSRLYDDESAISKESWNNMIAEFDSNFEKGDAQWGATFREFYAEHGDCVSSDREVVAYMIAYNDIVKS